MAQILTIKVPTYQINKMADALAKATESDKRVIIRGEAATVIKMAMQRSRKASKPKMTNRLYRRFWSGSEKLSSSDIGGFNRQIVISSRKRSGMFGGGAVWWSRKGEFRGKATFMGWTKFGGMSAPKPVRRFKSGAHAEFRSLFKEHIAVYKTFILNQLNKIGMERVAWIGALKSSGFSASDIDKLTPVAYNWRRDADNKYRGKKPFSTLKENESWGRNNITITAHSQYSVPHWQKKIAGILSSRKKQFEIATKKGMLKSATSIQKQYSYLQVNQ